MKYRVAISVSSFGEADKEPMKILEEANVEIIENPYKRRMTEEEIIGHLHGIDGLIAGLEPLNAKVLRSSPTLKVIARVGIGMDNIDLKTAKELNIRVSNTPDGPTEAVAELCLTALLSLGRRIISFDKDLHQGLWNKQMGIGLRATKVLLIGYGRIGKKFGDYLKFFGADIYVTDPRLKQADLVQGEKFVSFIEGIKQAEVVSLHASGTSTILGKTEFQKMKPGVILLNSARGELIDERALVQALENGTVKSAWIDTFSAEPYNGLLTKFEQVLLTPHISTYTIQCRRSMESSAANNLILDLNRCSHNQ
jgi:D-3-phosphoglycerate dehydrogenase / 2-oxoglutarate reductase